MTNLVTITATIVSILAAISIARVAAILTYGRYYYSYYYYTVSANALQLVVLLLLLLL